MKRNNDIYIPTNKELESLRTFVSDDKLFYDYLIAKLLEVTMWECYKIDEVDNIPTYVYDNLLVGDNEDLIKEIFKSLIRIYPEMINKDKGYTNLIDIFKFDCSTYCTKNLFSCILESVKINLESFPRYRFEYRQSHDNVSKEMFNLLDNLFGGTFSDIVVQKELDLGTLRNLLFIDPIYVTKFSDEDYLKIYANSGIDINRAEYFKNRDSIVSIDRFLNRYKLISGLWDKTNSKKITDNDVEEKCKRLLKRK